MIGLNNVPIASLNVAYAQYELDESVARKPRTVPCATLSFGELLLVKRDVEIQDRDETETFGFLLETRWRPRLP